jgi:hypothetical protein
MVLLLSDRVEHCYGVTFREYKLKEIKKGIQQFGRNALTNQE